MLAMHADPEGDVGQGLGVGVIGIVDSPDELEDLGAGSSSRATSTRALSPASSGLAATRARAAMTAVSYRASASAFAYEAAARSAAIRA